MTLFLIKKLINFKVAIAEMYPRIPWELFADLLGSVEHIMGNAGQRLCRSFIVN